LVAARVFSRASFSCCPGGQVISVSLIMWLPGFYPGWGKFSDLWPEDGCHLEISYK
jgi:hypothetical protein